jgi:hypothetical protein
MECRDSTVMATLRVTGTTTTPLVTGLKLRCIRTVDLQDDDADEGAATPTPPAAPVVQPAPPVAQTPAPAETDEQRAAREREEELRAIEQAMLQEELGRG